MHVGVLVCMILHLWTSDHLSFLFEMVNLHFQVCIPFNVFASLGRAFVYSTASLWHLKLSVATFSASYCTVPRTNFFHLVAEGCIVHCESQSKVHLFVLYCFFNQVFNENQVIVMLKSAAGRWACGRLQLLVSGQ